MFDGLLKDDLEQKTPTKYGFAKGWYGRKRNRCTDRCLMAARS
jgi:hypothetical protein